MSKNDKRNYEFRTIPGVNPDIRVSRDGEVQVKGVTRYDVKITAIDGTRMSTQMAIHKAFPDIPLRYAPTR